MKRIFGKRFWKFFSIMFLTTMLVNFAYILATYIPEFYPLSLGQGLNFALLGTLLALPSALCMATAIACFVAFRKANFKGTADFVKTFALTAGCFLLLSGAVYVYNLTVHPEVKVETMLMLFKVKTGRFFPEAIGDNNNDNFSVNYLRNETPIAFSHQKLRFRIDSISDAQKEYIQECHNLLKKLPKELADEAYDSYKMQLLGVEYGYDATTSIPLDSALFLQRNTLYYAALQLADSHAELAQYKIENYKRYIDSVSLLLSFVIFALAGYCSRNKSMNKIFGILAIIIVAAALLLSITRYTESVMLNIKRDAREYGSRY